MAGLAGADLMGLRARFYDTIGIAVSFQVALDDADFKFAAFDSRLKQRRLAATGATNLTDRKSVV